MSMNVKKGDTVVVLSGKDRGKQGKVLGSVPKDSRVVVEGVNVMRRPSPPARCRWCAPSAARVPALPTRLKTARASACANTAAPRCEKGE